MICIRGAITAAADTRREILENTNELLSQILVSNELDKEKITAIFFTCTKDLEAAYPAVAARELGFTDTALMCFQEMYVEGSLEKCIRVCVFYDEKMDKAKIKNIYLKEAAGLRPDLKINE